MSLDPKYSQIPAGLQYIVDNLTRARYNIVERMLQKPRRPTAGIAHCWACRGWVGFEVAYDRCAGHFIEHLVDDTATRCMGSGTPVGKLGSRTPQGVTAEIKFEKYARVGF